MKFVHEMTKDVKGDFFSKRTSRELKLDHRKLNFIDSVVNKMARPKNKISVVASPL